MRLLILLLLFACLCTNTAVAQRYFDSTDNYYYLIYDSTREFVDTTIIPNNGYIRPVWTTATKRIDDSTYQFDLFKVINFKYIGDSLPECFSQDAAGPCGHRIIESPNAVTLFNAFYEPILLKLNTPADSSWVGFENDSLFVLTTRLTDTLKNILDSTYTINRFRWSVFSRDSTADLSNKYHNLIIEIAAGLGIVSLPVISHFPYDSIIYKLELSGKINLRKQQHLGLTIVPKAELRYEIGDEFHSYREEVGPGLFSGTGMGEMIWKRDVVLSKQSLTDSVIYKYISSRKKRKWYDSNNEPNTNYDSNFYYTDTLTYNCKKGLPDKDQLRSKNETSLSSRYVYSHRFKSVGYFNENFQLSRVDSLWCYRYQFYDVSYKTFFSIGIPFHETYYHNLNIPGYYVSRLIYAKRNGQTWGTPYPKNVGMEEQYSAPSEAKLYPNPAKTSLTISLPQTGAGIESINIYDPMGKLIITQSNTLHQCVIDVSSIPVGIYWALIKLSNGQNISSKIMINHD